MLLLSVAVAVAIAVAVVVVVVVAAAQVVIAVVEIQAEHETQLGVVDASINRLKLELHETTGWLNRCGSPEVTTPEKGSMTLVTVSAERRILFQTPPPFSPEATCV